MQALPGRRHEFGYKTPMRGTFAVSSADWRERQDGGRPLFPQPVHSEARIRMQSSLLPEAGGVDQRKLPPSREAVLNFVSNSLEQMKNAGGGSSGVRLPPAGACR